MPEIDGNNKATIQTVFEVVKMNKKGLDTLDKKFDDFSASVHETQLNCMSRFACLEQQQITEKEVKEAYADHKKSTKKYRILVITLLFSLLGALSGFTIACASLIQILNGG